MAKEDAIRVNDDLEIAAAELEMRATRSGGPGGQHVNTSSTRIELVWDVGSSVALSEDQRQLLLERLASRIDGEGKLRLVAQAHRSQLQNRKAVRERLARLVAESLVVAAPRRPTRPTRAARERRLRDKRIRSALKQDRSRKGDDDG